MKKMDWYIVIVISSLAWLIPNYLYIYINYYYGKLGINPTNLLTPHSTH